MSIVLGKMPRRRTRTLDSPARAPGTHARSGRRPRPIHDACASDNTGPPESACRHPYQYCPAQPGAGACLDEATYPTPFRLGRALVRRQPIGRCWHSDHAEHRHDRPDVPGDKPWPTHAFRSERVTVREMLAPRRRSPGDAMLYAALKQENSEPHGAEEGDSRARSAHTGGSCESKHLIGVVLWALRWITEANDAFFGRGLLATARSCCPAISGADTTATGSSAANGHARSNRAGPSGPANPPEKGIIR